MARPCKLTPERQERIVAGLRGGAFAEVAARAAGVSPSTFYVWLERRCQSLWTRGHPTPRRGGCCDLTGVYSPPSLPRNLEGSIPSLVTVSYTHLTLPT